MADWLADVQARVADVDVHASSGDRWLKLWRLVHDDVPRLLACAEALAELVAAFEAEDAWPFSLELRAAARAGRAALQGDGAE